MMIMMMMMMMMTIVALETENYNFFYGQMSHDYYTCSVQFRDF